MCEGLSICREVFMHLTRLKVREQSILDFLYYDQGLQQNSSRIQLDYVPINSLGLVAPSTLLDYGSKDPSTYTSRKQLLNPLSASPHFPSHKVYQNRFDYNITLSLQFDSMDTKKLGLNGSLR